ncbi:acetyltransferase [Rhodococcus sp. D2-41]|uniref:GNAT family N-acetyltransferase n=1 Tax=Speluncibacter jeojiensis TaxID=2710754 RepID=UPI00240FB15B|nr:GNAT family N-acetyltransferase [Rhodococcus sp. D2-41]MDG3009882.1 acetyltransferase [Rhodococcus sp. D2-41]
MDSHKLLPRHRTEGLPPEVLAAPAPPVPQLPDPFRVRVVDPDGDDPALVATWMNRPHLAATWERAWPTEQWHAHLRAQLATEYSRPLIAAYDGVDVAYVEVYRPAQDIVGAVYQAWPNDLGVHVAVGDPQMTGRGLVSRAMNNVVRSLFFAEPDCHRIMYDPDHRNRPVRALLESAGAVGLGLHDVPGRRIALYATVRSAEHMPRLRSAATAEPALPRPDR